MTSEPRARPSRLWFSVHRTVRRSGGMGAAVVHPAAAPELPRRSGRVPPRVSRRWQRRVLDVVRLGGIPQTDPFRVPGRPDVRMVPATRTSRTTSSGWASTATRQASPRGGPRSWAHTERRSKLGANIGLYTVLGCICGDGRPYTAVEPNPVSSAALRRNLELNGLDHVNVVEAAVIGTRVEEAVTLRFPDRDVYGTSAGAFVDGAVDLDAAASAVRQGACATCDGPRGRRRPHQDRHRRARGRGAVHARPVDLVHDAHDRGRGQGPSDASPAPDRRRGGRRRLLLRRGGGRQRRRLPPAEASAGRLAVALRHHATSPSSPQPASTTSSPRPAEGQGASR